MNYFQKAVQKIVFRRIDPSTLTPDHAQKIQYIYTVLLLMLAIGVPFFIRAVQWNIPLRIMGVGTALTIALTLLLVNPNRRYLSLNANIAILALSAAVIPAILSNGGFSGAAIGWLTIFPLLGGFLSGYKSAVAWALMSLTSLIVFYTLELQGVHLPNLTPEEHVRSQKLLQYLGILIALFFIVSNFLSSIEASEKKFKDLIVKRDIEIKHREEAELRAKQASKTKSQFLANISHELRTPMNAIIGMAQLTLDSRLSKDQQHQVEVIENSSHLLLRLINDILDFSKIEANKLELEEEPFLFDEMIVNLASMFNFATHQKNLKLYLDIDPAIPFMLLADELRITQVLTNIISNAIKFTPMGSVTISAKISSENGEQSNSNEIDILFTVSDTGIGIPADKLETLFAPFTQADTSTTRKYGGTGLGLSITKRLIQLMNGDINVLSEENKGSEFQLKIPVHISSNEPENCLYCDHFQRVLGNCSNKTALIAISDSKNQAIMNKLLRSFSLNCVSHPVSNDESLQIDLLITDYEPKEYLPLLASSTIPVCLILQSQGSAVSSVNIYDEHQKQGHPLQVETISSPLCRSTLLTALGHVYSSERDTKQTPEEVPEHALLPLTGQIILVVEDNVVNQEVAKKILQKFGAEVHIANHGSEALEMLPQYQFDAILMDLQMPVMDGIQATIAIRNQRKFAQLPILAMSAHVKQSDIDICYEAGMNDYIPKPYRKEQLLESLMKWTKKDVHS